MLEHNNHHLFVLAEGSMSMDRKVQQLIQQALRHSFLIKVRFLSPSIFEHKNHHIFILKTLLHSLRNQTNAIRSLIALAEQLPGSLKERKVDRNLRYFYDQAVTQIEKGMSRNLDNFPNLYDLDLLNADPSVIRQCFVRWYNLILRRKLIDLWRVQKNQPPVSLDEPIGEDGETTKGENIGDSSILSPIEQAIVDEHQRQQQRLLDYLTQDPDQTLHNCGSKKYPDCNCWEICKMRLQQPPRKWEDIAKALNVSFGSVTSHWQRRCKPLLRDIAKKFGLDAE